MTAYYNDTDKAAAAVLREQIASGVIAHGIVDTRSIKDIQPDELEGFTQLHFFAGGGFWSVAARLAGWPDDRPLWTGSCPCQPFSQAGKQAGSDDPRHLWPDFHRLISAGRPAEVMGEQVAGALGYGWFDGVATDLEREDYACRAVDIPACAVDSPQIRNRLYWIAVANARGGCIRSEGRHADTGTAPGMRGAPRQQRLRADPRSADSDRVGTSDVANPGYRSGGGFRTQRGPDRRGLFGPRDDAGQCRGVDLVDPSSLRRREGWAEHELWGRRDTVAGADAPVSHLGSTESGCGEGLGGRETFGRQARSGEYRGPDAGLGRDHDMGNGDHPGPQGVEIAERFEGTPTGRSDAERADRGDCGRDGEVAGAKGGGPPSWDAGALPGDAEPQRPPEQPERRFDGHNGSYWSSSIWIDCHDQKKRRAESSIPLLVDGFPGRVDLWRLAGNAINVELAAEVIRAYLDTEGAL